MVSSYYLYIIFIYELIISYHRFIPTVLSLYLVCLFILTVYTSIILFKVHLMFSIYSTGIATDEARKYKEKTGTGKGRGRRGRTKGGKIWTRAGGEVKGNRLGRDHSTPPQTDTCRAE